MSNIVDKFRLTVKKINKDYKSSLESQNESDAKKIQELKNTFQLQEEKLNELAKDRATLTNMLELQKTTLTNLLLEKDQEVMSLEEQLNKLTVAKKSSTGSFSNTELNFAPMDIESSVDEVVPMVKEMSRKNQVGFTFQIDEMENPVVKADSLYVNAMILKMFSDAFDCCEKRSKIIFYIRQKTEAVDGWAEYEYSCIYLGDSLQFDSETVDALGGRVTIDRSHGGNVVTVRLKFEVCDEG